MGADGSDVRWKTKGLWLDVSTALDHRRGALLCLVSMRRITQAWRPTRARVNLHGSIKHDAPSVDSSPVLTRAAFRALI